ncbi:hypothetical protein HKX48_001713 [Thoreauomyces humboldtii]|nr:hypothetical protein HKX48_001713 [Thoreauomyces humboldtii]
MTRFIALSSRTALSRSLLGRAFALRASARPIASLLTARPITAQVSARSFSVSVFPRNNAGAQLQEDDIVDAVNGFGGHIAESAKPVTQSAAEGTFASIAALSEHTQTALRHDFKYVEMSSVQKAVLSLLPTEKDLLVRAKTGTGKTLAFMIAALESAIARRGDERFDRNQTTILCLSPTRELALQIAAEAARLTKPHGYRVQTAVGGPGRNKSVRDIVRDRCDILVATPGRLLDMLENEANFRTKMRGLQTLIFDEADQLLEMGFRDAIESIVRKLPEQRQTFMFSATLSKDIQNIARRTLQSGYDYVDTVPTNETPTHMKVKQTYAVIPFSQQLVMLHEIIKTHREAVPEAKIIVFFATTKVVAYLAGVFNDLPGMDVLEIHSKLTQVQRSRVAGRFRRAENGILFTSDVSARGVDYPGVTLVIQVGMPTTREQYIHRVGRTGRANKEGEGIIMLSPYEQGFVDLLTEIPIKRDLRYGPDSDVLKDDKTKELLEQARKHAPKDMAVECYAAYLGFHKQAARSVGVGRDTLVKGANEYATGFLGLETPPTLSDRMINNLGLKNVRGITPRGSSYGGGGSSRSSYEDRGGGPSRSGGNYGSDRSGAPRRSSFRD